MKTARILLVGVILASLMVPLAYGIFFIGPTMFIATHGGITTFSQNFQAYSLTYGTGLNQFTNLVWAGHLRGNFGVDADTGVNITVTQIGRDQVTYTVTTAAPGAVVTYIYYYRNVAGQKLRPPTEVTVNGAPGAFTYGGGIANITTTGSPRTVVVSYLGGVGSTAVDYSIGILIQLFPVVALVVTLEARRQDLIGNKLMVLGLLIAALGIFLWMIRAAGY